MLLQMKFIYLFGAEEALERSRNENSDLSVARMDGYERLPLAILQYGLPCHKLHLSIELDGILTVAHRMDGWRCYK